MDDDSVKKDISQIKADIQEIKVDLKYHVKRTDDLQAMVEPLADLRKEIKGVIKLAQFLAVLAGIAECIHLFWK